MSTENDLETPQTRAQTPSPEKPAGRNNLRNIGLITWREYKNQVSRRSFLVISIIYLIIIVAGSFAPTIIQYITTRVSTPTQTHIALINTAGTVAEMNNASLLATLTTNLNAQGTSSTWTPMAASALNTTRSAVKNGQFAALLVIERGAGNRLDFTCYTASTDPDDTLAAQIQQAASQINVLDQAERQHLTSAQIASLFTPPVFTTTNLSGQSNTYTSAWVAGLVLAYIGVVLIFIMNILYGTSVAQGVAEEKGNRIMELLMLAATPFQLMVGKIIGIGAAGLTQMGALVLIGLGMLALQHPLHTALLGNASGGLALAITGASATMLLLVLLYFILSFALYSSLYAAAGALVQRQDEAQNASTPITMLSVVGYAASLTVVSIPGAPDALWFKILSYIPFWTPTTMLVRIAVGTVAWWEIPLTVLLMALGFLVCSWISARIYRYGVLRYGQRFSFGQLLRVLRAG
jgi:ABC-2 type transport system permease protein